MDDQGAEWWDAWWRRRLARDTTDCGPLSPSWFHLHWGNLFNLSQRDDLLVHVMAEYGLRSVLCAGNGVSQEPRALARAGFDVTAMDISAVAMAFAENYEPKPKLLGQFVSPSFFQPGGRLQFVVGNLLDSSVCPGPFDVVIERRTVERFAAPDLERGLSALAERLSPVGIFLSMCFDDNFPAALGWSQHESGYFHASESWFRRHGWTLWEDVPRSPLVGQAALLVRAGSLKRRPDNLLAGSPGNGL